MNSAGPEPDADQPAKAKKPQWHTFCDIVSVLAVAYFVFLLVALLIAPKGTRNWTVFALHFAVTFVVGYGAKWLVGRHDERQASMRDSSRESQK